MNTLERYFKDILDVETAVSSLEKKLFLQLPLFITVAYKLQETTVYGNRICLLTAEDVDNLPPPDRLLKQMRFVSQKIELPVAYVFGKIVSYNIKRMIQKQIKKFIFGYTINLHYLCTENLIIKIWHKLQV